MVFKKQVLMRAAHRTILTENNIFRPKAIITVTNRQEQCTLYYNSFLIWHMSTHTNFRVYLPCYYQFLLQQMHSFSNTWAAPGLRWSVAGLSPRTPGLDPRPVHVAFLVASVAAKQGFPLSFSFHHCSVFFIFDLSNIDATESQQLTASLHLTRNF